MRLQKMIGVLCLLLSVAIIAMSIVFNEGATAICITIPLGLWMIFSKECLIDIEEDDDEEF